MMKEIQYKDFSLRTHKKNWRINKPNVCQFELTFSCDFHCLYCYSDCYNNPGHIKKELSTNAVKMILDKVYEAGCLWLCFTGGDPLKREDFLEIYAYAKKKGFIITIFTNGYSLTKRIADFLTDEPPFVVELTINAVSKKTFEEISQVPDSYEKTLEGLKMLIERKIPLKIKTMLIKNNLEQLPKIKNFIAGLGLKFRPGSFIYARLNKDIYPCSLRITPQEAFDLYGGSNLVNTEKPVLNADGRRCNADGRRFSRRNNLRESAFDSRESALKDTFSMVTNLDSRNKEDGDCFYPPYNQTEDTEDQRLNTLLFRCAAGSGDGVSITPYGRMIFCPSLREPSIDLLKQDIPEALFRLFPQMRQKTFSKNSPCFGCQIRHLCYSCPGNAFLEKGDMELPIEWFCELAHLMAGYKLHATSHKLQAVKYRRENAEL